MKSRVAAAGYRRCGQVYGRSQKSLPTAIYHVSVNPMVSKLMVFDTAGNPTTGAAKFPVVQEGCGEKRILNVWAWVQTSAGCQNLPSPRPSLAIAPFLPGTTRADPQLQKDAVSYAWIAAGGVDATCKSGHVAETEFLEQENVALPGAKGTPWRELWTLVWCVNRIQVPIRFIPDRTGTTISTGPNTAIKVLPLGSKAP